MRINILDVPIDKIGMEQTIDKIEEFILSGEPHLVVTPNVDHVLLTRRDPDFKKIYDEANLSVVDGVPLLWAASFLNQPLVERVNGTDLFVNLCELAANKNYKVFFLGSAPGVADRASENLQKKFNGLNVVGTCSPPLGFEHDDEENKKVVNVIKEAKPDILFVALGAPKQEKWAHKYKSELKASVIVGIGASLEYLAGHTKRAPKWMQKAGLEWFFRVASAPLRYGRRYLGDLSFFPLILMVKIRKTLQM